MSKMQIAPTDRPKVKAECLRLLVILKLDPTRTQLISQVVDTYLRLNAQEDQTFQTEIDKLDLRQQEARWVVDICCESSSRQLLHFR